MDNKIELIICLGSSCFSRGNKDILPLIQEYIKRNKLENRVNFHGRRCFDNCAQGPVLSIDGRSFYGVESKDLEELLDNALGIKNGKL